MNKNSFIKSGINIFGLFFPQKRKNAKKSSEKHFYEKTNHNNAYIKQYLNIYAFRLLLFAYFNKIAAKFANDHIFCNKRQIKCNE